MFLENENSNFMKVLAIQVGSGNVIGEIDDDGYKYLGIMERSDISQENMKKMSMLNTLNL